MRRDIPIILAVIMAAMHLCSCSTRNANGDTGIRLEELTDEWAALAMEENNQELIDSARPVLRKALEEGDYVTASYAGAYIAQAFSMMFLPDSMYYYIDLLNDKAGKIEDGFPTMAISNTVGVYNLIYSMNYSEALHYFYEALDHCSDARNRAMILWNIVNTCYLRKDTTGLEYAKEIYGYGKDNSDDYITYIGSLACAYMFYEAGRMDSALFYVENTTRLDAYNGNINNSDALHGNILAAMGRDKEAEQYFERAIAYSYPDYSTLIESYLSYGQFLKDNGRPKDAIAYFHKGLSLTEEHSMYFWGHKLYNALAETYSSMGRDDLAVDYIRTYSVITDSIFNIEKERSFENLRRNYERQKQEIEIQKRDISILKEQRKVYLLLFSAVALGITALAFFIIMKRKSNMYKRLVKSYDSYIMAGKKQDNRQATTSSSDEEQRNSAKLKAIYDAIEKKMQEDLLFKNNELTVENASDAIDTNRSYLSKAINTFAGTSFNSYVNTYRIRYAASLLSDPENEMPIKAIALEAGYNNLQSFYKNFQKETGVPPSKYRQEIININKERNISNIDSK